MGKKESFTNPKILMDLPADAKLVGSNNTKKIISKLPEDAKPIDTIDSNPYLKQQQEEKNNETRNQIIDNIQDIDDSGKETLRDLTNRGIKGNELRDAILTLQTKHPKQNGGHKFYYDDKGIPRPLDPHERPPVGYEVASVWGSRKDTEDDGKLTTFAKNVFNIIPSVAENVVDLVHLPYALANDGKEAEWYKKAKNNAEYLKMQTSDKSKEQMLNTDGIDEFSDIFDSKRWKFTPDNIVGTIGSLVKSVGEFFVGGEVIKPLMYGGKAAALASIGEKAAPLSKLGNTTALGVASYMTQVGDIIDDAKQAGLNNKDAYQFASLVTIPIAGLDLVGGFEGKILRDQTARLERKNLMKTIVKGMEKDAEGNITPQALKEAFDVTMVSNAQLTKTWAKETALDAGSEAAQEMAQAFTQAAGEQLYDHLDESEKKKFGTDAFGPKAFADYLQQGIAGLLGGAPTSIAYQRIKKTAQAENESKTAFGLVQKGDEAINAFKKNAAIELQQGKLTLEEHDNALFKVDRYNEYNKAISAKNINDDTKRRIFDLTFQKGQLIKQLEAEKTQDNPDGINDASIQSKEGQIKDIEKEVKSLVLPSQIMDQGVAADKTVEDAIKHHDKTSGLDLLEKEAEKAAKDKGKKQSSSAMVKEMLGKYGKEVNQVQDEKKEVPELRKFEEIPTADWNTKKANEKFNILSEHLDTTNQSQVGEVHLIRSKNGQSGNDTVHIKLPNDKWVIFASSATNLNTGNRGHLHTEHLPENFDGQKVVIKPTRLTTGRIILPVYNGETGKYVGYVREDNTGNANEKLFVKRAEKIGVDKAEGFAEVEKNELQHILTTKLTKNEIEAINIPNANGEVKQGAKTVTSENTKAQTQPNEEKTVKENNGKKSTEGVTTSQEESTTGNNTEVSKEGNPPSKTKALKVGTKRSRQKITDPIRLKALAIESDKPYDLVQQYFIKNGHIARSAISGLYRDSQKEINKRFGLWKIDAPTIKELAHDLWEGYSDLGFGESKFDTEDFRDAIEEVINNFHSRTEMAQDLVKRWKVATERMEEYMSSELAEAEKQGVEEDVNAIIDEAESLGNDEITDLANDQTKFDVWGNPIIDITRNEDLEGDQFQKQKASKPSLELEKHEAVLKVAKRIQKVLPDIKVVYDKGLQAAGKWSPKNKVLSINPYYAGIDTPIHEAGHILIDVLGGMNNKVVAKAVNQLKKSDLYAETKERYPELNEEQLGYEVLAEAIGREGAGIFKDVIAQNKFKQFIDYIFDWLKRNLGLEKNIAKNLSRQIISGIGINKLVSGVDSLQKNDYLIKKEALRSEWEKVKDDKNVYEYGTSENDKTFAKATYVSPKFKILQDYLKLELEQNGYDILNQTSAKSGSSYIEAADKSGKYQAQEFRISDHIGRGGVFTPDASFSTFDDIDTYFNKEKVQVGTKLIDKKFNGPESSFNNSFPNAKNVTKEFDRSSKAGNNIYNYDFQLEVPVYEYKDKGDQLQKPFTPFEEKSHEQQVKALTLSFEQYSKEILNRDVISEAENLKHINDALENPDLTDEDKEQLELVHEAISQRKKQDLFSWLKYRKDIKLATIINYDLQDLENSLEKGDLNEQEYLDGMIALYNVVTGMQEAARKTVESNVMNKLSYALFQNQKEELKKNEKFVEEIANKADMSAKDVWLKNLGHVTEKVPELQAFSKMYDEATFDKVTEAKENKNTFEKLGTAVIKEKNKQLGITGTIKSLFSSDSAKYFDWIDNGDGEMITVEEAEKKGLSKAHIEFLKYYRELVAEHQRVNGDIYNAPLQVLKTDPTFKETFKQDSITQAFSNFLGTNYNLKQVRVEFTDPETRQKAIASFGDIENKLVEYGKKGILEKGKALALILKYNRQARIQLKKGINADEKENPLHVKNNSQYSINNKGILTSKFDRVRDKNRGYSKDFYRAGIEFIDDMAHVKHMSKLVPVINSIEFLNQNGYAEHLAKPNVVKYIKEWKDLHMFKNPKETLPEVDAVLRFVRFLTSATTMMFNVPAGIMNLSMGLYNNWRAETDAWRAKGHGRLFLKGGRKVNKDYAYGFINPKAVDILRKYHIVSIDYDSNPKLFAGRVFDNIAHALTRYGEFQIQGTNFLGQLTDDEWNSFEYKTNKHGIDELVLKDGVDEKDLKNKFITYKNKISDIQGKYSAADMRNFTNNELGKSAAQFKNWIPDWWRMRFGERYIDRNGEVKQGSWRVFVGEGLDELRSDIQEKGYMKAFWENKDFMSNLKGAMVTVMFMALAHDDDDDKKRKNGAIDADNALSQLLFVFDPAQLKFTITRPIAAVGTIEKFIDAAQALIDADTDKFEKNLIKLTPANKILKVADMFE